MFSPHTLDADIAFMSPPLRVISSAMLYDGAADAACFRHAAAAATFSRCFISLPFIDYAADAAFSLFRLLPLRLLLFR